MKTVIIIIIICGAANIGYWYGRWTELYLKRLKLEKRLIDVTELK